MTEQPERYYLNGDQKEGAPDLWFCSRCDLFVSEVHFSEDHHSKQRLSNYEVYLAEIKSLPLYMKNTRGKMRRPANPPNCLA